MIPFGDLAAFVLMLASLAVPAFAAPELVAANDNRSPAGMLRDGVLTIRLEARVGEIYPDGQHIVFRSGRTGSGIQPTDNQRFVEAVPDRRSSFGACG